LIDLLDFSCRNTSFLDKKPITSSTFLTNDFYAYSNTDTLKIEDFDGNEIHSLPEYRNASFLDYSKEHFLLMIYKNKTLTYFDISLGKKVYESTHSHSLKNNFCNYNGVFSSFSREKLYFYSPKSSEPLCVFPACEKGTIQSFDIVSHSLSVLDTYNNLSTYDIRNYFEPVQTYKKQNYSSVSYLSSQSLLLSNKNDISVLDISKNTKNSYFTKNLSFVRKKFRRARRNLEVDELLNKLPPESIRIEFR